MYMKSIIMKSLMRHNKYMAIKHLRRSLETWMSNMDVNWKLLILFLYIYFLQKNSLRQSSFAEVIFSTVTLPACLRGFQQHPFALFFPGQCSWLQQLCSRLQVFKPGLMIFICGIGEGAVATPGPDFSRSRSEAWAATTNKASICKDWPIRYGRWCLLTFSVAKQATRPSSSFRREMSTLLSFQGGVEQILNTCAFAQVYCSKCSLIFKEQYIFIDTHMPSWFKNLFVDLLIRKNTSYESVLAHVNQGNTPERGGI